LKVIIGRTAAWVQSKTALAECTGLLAGECGVGVGGEESGKRVSYVNKRSGTTSGTGAPARTVCSSGADLAL